jgi:hypothetical protein
MPPPVTGKQRAARIPLDYYKHPTFLNWGRGWWAFLIAVLVPVAWIGSGYLMSGQGQTYYSRGPVTAVHATWDHDCMACHTAFTPLSGDAYTKHFVMDNHAMNQKCEACHKGPPHHPDATPELACAACHHDHRGRDASLVRMNDNDCTQCHADLLNHMANAKPTIDPKVTAFAAAAHPEFKALRDNAKDPGNLKFNHKLHLQKDLKVNLMVADDKGGQKMQSTEANLDCSSCHHLDAGDATVKRAQLTDVPSAAVLPARTGGAYYLPINYETDCRSCHPLTFEKESKGQSLPHRLQPAQVDQYLENYYAAQYLKGNREVFETFVPLRPLPGKLPEGKEAMIRDVIQGKVQNAERYVWSKSTCEECHVVERGAEAKVTSILPTNVPDVWFHSARFDHSAHRAVDFGDKRRRHAARRLHLLAVSRPAFRRRQSGQGWGALRLHRMSPLSQRRRAVGGDRSQESGADSSGQHRAVSDGQRAGRKRTMRPMGLMRLMGLIQTRAPQ